MKQESVHAKEKMARTRGREPRRGPSQQLESKPHPLGEFSGLTPKWPANSADLRSVERKEVRVTRKEEGVDEEQYPLTETKTRTWACSNNVHPLGAQDPECEETNV